MAEVSACNWSFVEVLAFQVTDTGIPHCRHSVNEIKRWRSRLQGRDITSCPTGIRDGPCIQNYWIV